MRLSLRAQVRRAGRRRFRVAAGTTTGHLPFTITANRLVNGLVHHWHTDTCVDEKNAQGAAAGPIFSKGVRPDSGQGPSRATGRSRAEAFFCGKKRVPNPSLQKASYSGSELGAFVSKLVD